MPSAATPVDAVVTAGGLPRPDQPLYALTQGKPKALLPIAGRPMVQWVLDALNAAETVRRIVVVGLEPDEAAALSSRKEIAFVANQGSLIANTEAGVKKLLDQDAALKQALVVSADIPTLKGEHVDWITRACQETDHEIYYGLVSEAVMEARFPASKRSYFKLKEGKFCGSDINMFSTSLVGHYHPAWHTIVDSRKSILKQASLIGLDTLLIMALGQMTIPEALKRAKSKLGVNGRVLLLPHAEAGMDVDKPRQYELVKHDLESGAARA
ncbi:MAG: NTP transferase domain-containing protein [Anaerolineales bacterium]